MPHKTQLREYSYLQGEEENALKSQENKGMSLAGDYRLVTKVSRFSS